MPLQVLPENPNFIEDTDKGIVLPARMLQVDHIPHAFDDPNRPRSQSMRYGIKHRAGVGTLLEHEAETGIPYWPAYATGMDDFLMRSLVGGYMGNSAQTPVVDTLLSTIVAKIQGMVGTWINVVRGKESPVKKTLDLMSRANDSPFGSAEFVRHYMGALNVDNRGAIGAQVPIENIDVEKWGEFGMELEEIQGQRKKGMSNVKPDMFVLRMTTEAFRENQGLYMIDGLSCLPTGDHEYPYWIRKHMRSENRSIWVLIHRDFGFQILQQIGSKNQLYKGFGQSGSWRYSPYEIKHMAISQMDWEAIINQPARGVVWVSGLDTPTQFRDQLLQFQADLAESGAVLYPGVFFGGSVSDNAKITMIPWSEPPEGYNPKEWEDLKVSKLAAAFHLNETHLQLKLGEGAMTQSGVAQSLEAETAVAWMRHTIEMIWNFVSPPRVVVQVIWPSDRATRFQTETWREMSLAISRINQLDKELPPEERTYTRNEIRALTQEYIGIALPDAEEDDTTETGRSGPDDVGEMMSPFEPVSTLIAEHGLDRAAAFAKGNLVRLKSGKRGTITGWSGNADWVWIRTGEFEMLVPADRFQLIELSDNAWRSADFSPPVNLADMSEEDLAAGIEAGSLLWVGGKLEPLAYHARDRAPVKDPLISPHVFHAGQRVYVGENNVPATIIKANDDIAFIAYDWNPDPHNPKVFPLEELRPMGFEPEGEPLDPPTEVETDQDQATSDARDLWGELSPEGQEDLI